MRKGIRRNIRMRKVVPGKPLEPGSVNGNKLKLTRSDCIEINSPGSMLSTDNGPKPITAALKAIILHTFGVQVDPTPYFLISRP